MQNSGERLREYILFETYLSIKQIWQSLFLVGFYVFKYISYLIMIWAIKMLKKKKWIHVEDTEEDEQDAENENDADYQQEWILLKETNYN